MSAVQDERWIDVGAETEVPLLGARKIFTPFGPVAIFHLADGEFLAVEDRCPHKGGPLSDGIVHGQSVTCPLHNWQIDLRSGLAQAPDEGCVKTIPLRRVDGRVQLRLEAVAYG